MLLFFNNEETWYRKQLIVLKVMCLKKFQRLEKCHVNVTTLLNNLSEREANDALNTHVSTRRKFLNSKPWLYYHFFVLFKVKWTCLRNSNWLCIFDRCAKGLSSMKKCNLDCFTQFWQTQRLPLGLVWKIQVFLRF